ncbi:MAG: FKBP-type peptidyl-prolyl cis-trans isomerase [Phycisphaerales bacterium]
MLNCRPLVTSLIVAGTITAAAFAIQPPASEPAKAEPPKNEPAKSEPAKAEPAKTEAPKAEPVKAAEPELKPISRVEKEGGLVIEELVIGTGAEVKDGGLIVAHYRGTLKEGGAEFDSSYARGEPAIFLLKGLIPGWQEGIPGMKAGGKRRLTVPFAKGYGEQGSPPKIPAKADLMFDIELVDTVGMNDTKVGEGEAFSLDTPMPATPIIKYTGRVVGTDAPFATTGDTPLTANLRALIPGLTFGLDGMKVGGKRTVTFPALLGWQQKPAPFGDKARIEFEVELVGVKAPEMQMPPGR